MKLLLHLGLLLISYLSFSQGNTVYTFDYYSVYQYEFNGKMPYKLYYLGNATNKCYALKIATTKENEVLSLELIDVEKQISVAAKGNREILNDFRNLNNFITDYYSKSFAKKNNQYYTKYSSTNELIVGDYSLIEYIVYYNKKKNSISHKILVETKADENYKTQYYSRILFFFTDNHFGLINHETENVIQNLKIEFSPTSIYQENLIEIKPTQTTINLNL